MRISMKESFTRKPAAMVGKAKKVANNTFQYTNRDGVEVTRLHLTDIIYKIGGKTILNSGGWQTVTTKNRFNAYSDYMIYQTGGIWYIKTRENWRSGDDPAVEFYDGMVLPDAFEKAPPA